MNILVNTSNLKAGGGLQVADSFLSLLYLYTEHSFFVVLSEVLFYLERPMEKYANCTILKYDMPKSIGGLIWGKNAHMDSIVEKYRIDVVFSIFGPTLWRPKVRHVCGFARPQIIYTKSPFFKKISLKQKFAYKISEQFKLYNFDKTSDVLITENKDVSKRLSLKLPHKTVYTVTNYYNQIFDNKERWINDIQLPPFDGITLLTVSANYPHKNLDIIFKIIDFLQENKLDLKLRFVITLSKEQFPMSEKYQKYIILTGKLNIAQCPHLYEQADIVFLPTLLECFSASYAEAMRMGIPILTSDLTFARGLCGKAAEYCDSLSIKSILDGIIKLQYKKRKDELIEAGHQQLKKFDTTENRANKYIQIINNEI